MWLSHPTFLEEVQKCWSEYINGDSSFVFQSKLKRLKKYLQEWNWKVFGNIHVQIKDAERKVQYALLNSDNNPFNSEVLGKLVEAQNVYESKEVPLNTMLNQKSRIRWVKEGARNTKFFHTNLKIRQSRNFICELEDTNRDIFSDPKKNADVLVQHFEKKFEFKEVENVDSLFDGIPTVITQEDQEILDEVPNEEEIKTTFFNMDPDSSSRPDVFLGASYRAC
ncbi:uncharacterized protein LOC113351914 [Papaver somniferum]|uniref:uncharacterized protein LOC113351914 n=1 Tax=Papaver somniferum TaxID=3469 RepID=UPI000E705D09|nr:uncharacterized protein LOC113351914 [Papaver somniferum]